MLLAADYPFLNIFWTMILFFFWVAWIWILVGVITDLFRRHDASGWVKALWTVVMIFVPFLGVLSYLIVNGQGMSERSAKQTAAQQARYAEYASANGGGGSAGEIQKAKSLLDSGAITAREYDSLKAKALA
jgi:putative Ca2+/H+ antiporter (TMEM165/GDT1 family)